jgi:hypothetical protein
MGLRVGERQYVLSWTEETGGKGRIEVQNGQHVLIIPAHAAHNTPVSQNSPMFKKV